VGYDEENRRPDEELINEESANDHERAGKRSARELQRLGEMIPLAGSSEVERRKWNNEVRRAPEFEVTRGTRRFKARCRAKNTSVSVRGTLGPSSE